jgi:putative membrane protein
MCDKEHAKGGCMRVLWGLGKALTLIVWALVLSNLYQPLVYPFDVLINLVGSLLVLTHGLEVLLFKGRLQGRRHPWRDRLLILVFGVFHAHTLPASRERDSSHA